VKDSASALSRRRLLRTAVTVAGALGMTTLLEACTSSGGAPSPPTAAPAASKPQPSPTAAPAARIGTPGGKPEKASLKVGLPVDATSFLPVYVAADRTWKEEGLTVEVLSFRGDSEVSQALAGDSVDFTVQSVNGLINLISAGQPMMGFYAGFYQADFAWLAQPSIKRWQDLKGKTAGVSTFGSLTDFLTRYALKKHNLEPEQDVKIIQAGGTPSAFQAMKGGKLDAAILSPPFKWQAQEEGFTVLGTQVQEVAPEWPKHTFVAKSRLLEESPNTVLAILRGHVAGIRIVKQDRALAVKLMVERLKYTDNYASRAYDEVVNGFDERGTLPQRSMPVFWDIAVQAGDVKEPWPESKFLDRRYIDSFDQWAPKAS
jgi:NitT/TauT family transport system substrate-binding protein